MFPRAGYPVYLPAAPQTTVLPPSVFSQSPLATGCHNKASIFEITAQVAIKRFTFAVKETLITLPAGERPLLLDGLYYAAFISHNLAAGNKVRINGPRMRSTIRDFVMKGRDMVVAAYKSRITILCY